jgi:hypothetical protein
MPALYSLSFLGAASYFGFATFRQAFKLPSSGRMGIVSRRHKIEQTVRLRVGCSGFDLRNRRAGFCPVGNEHLVQEKYMKKL